MDRWLLQREIGIYLQQTPLTLTSSKATKKLPPRWRCWLALSRLITRLLPI